MFNFIKATSIQERNIRGRSNSSKNSENISWKVPRSSRRCNQFLAEQAWKLLSVHKREKFTQYARIFQNIPEYPIISHNIPAYPIISQYIPSYTIISHHIPSYLIISQHIPSYPIISQHMPEYSRIGKCPKIFN